VIEGRPAAALDQLLALANPQHPTAHAAIALLATRDLVEAAARAHRLEGLEPYVASFERWARWERGTWTVMNARLSRALITHGKDAERHYQAALATDRLGERPFDLACTELAYGAWLRRCRRRSDARPHLRAALGLFEELAAAPWADQARAELRASGESARKRDPSTRYQLTPPGAGGRPARRSWSVEQRDRGPPVPERAYRQLPPAPDLHQARDHLPRPAGRTRSRQ
jgi:hypothetical protein